MDTYMWNEIYPLAIINEDLKELYFLNVAKEINALLGAGAFNNPLKSEKVLGKSIINKNDKFVILDDKGADFATYATPIEAIQAVLSMEKMDIEKAKAKPPVGEKPKEEAAKPAKTAPKGEKEAETKDDSENKIKPNYGVKKNDSGLSWEVEIPIHKLDGEKQLVGGVVYEPDVVDAQGDSASEEEIQKAAHNFMIDSKTVGIMHKEDAGPRAKIVESYITTARMQIGTQFVKRGTWVMVVKILDPELWNMVKTGQYTGFSMGGRAVEDTSAAV